MSTGRGHKVHDGVQQLLHALVLVRSAAGDGNQQVLDGALTQGLADHILGHGLLFQHQHHDLLVEVGAGVDELGAVFLSQLHHVGGDLLHTHVLAQVIVIDIGIHLHQVDDTLEGILGTDGELDGHSIALETIIDHVSTL